MQKYHQTYWLGTNQQISDLIESHEIYDRNAILQYITAAGQSRLNLIIANNDRHKLTGPV